jgi:hypothetical protein
VAVVGFTALRCRPSLLTTPCCCQGLYGAQLETYVRLFGARQVLAMDFKTFAKDPATATNRVLAFGGNTTQPTENSLGS